MKLIKLIENSNFDWNKVIFFYDSGISLTHDFEITPEDFLGFAKKDVQQGGKRGLVNALSNAKRAIDCEVKKVLMIFNLKPKRNNFPSRLEILGEIGVITPRIIRKVIKTRNYLEHEFTLPKKGKVEDAVDIADLFIRAANGVLNGFPDSFALAEGSFTCHDDMDLWKKGIHFNFDDEKKVWRAFSVKNEAVVKPTDSNYKTLIKIAASFGKDEKAHGEAIMELSNNAN